MKRYLRLGLAALLCSIYFSLAPFGYVAFAIWHHLPSPDPLSRARRLQGIMRRAFALMHDTLRLCGYVDFNPRKISGTLPDGPVVLVANHPTLMDVTSVMAAFKNVTTAVKPNLFRRFWFRGLLHDARLFEGADGPFALGDVIEAAASRIREGFHVLIFPEGTRSPEGSLHAFGRTAFEVACRVNVAVVPVVIRCQPVWLSKEHPLWPPRQETVRFSLTALEPVHPASCGRSSRQLRDVVEALFSEQLRRTPVQGFDDSDEQRCSKTQLKNDSSNSSWNP